MENKNSETVQKSDCGDDEDTDETSEVDLQKQMYENKLKSLRMQLQQLKEGTNPEYNRLNAQLVQDYENRMFNNDILKSHLMYRCEQTYQHELKSAVDEFEEKKKSLKEGLLAEYEEKKRVVVAERFMKLNNDCSKEKQTQNMKNKLRKRQNDVGLAERSKKSSSLNYLLGEKEVESDLEAVSNVPQPPADAPSTSQLPKPQTQDPRVENGKLKYEKRFFHRGQPVSVEGEEVAHFAGNIYQIGTNFILIKRTSDGSIFKLFLNQLVEKKVHIERRIP